VSPSLVHAYLFGYQRRIARWAPKWLSVFTDVTENKEAQWLQDFATHRVRLSSIVRIIEVCRNRQTRIEQTLKHMEELSFVKERIKKQSQRRQKASHIPTRRRLTDKDIDRLANLTCRSITERQEYERLRTALRLLTSTAPGLPAKRQISKGQPSKGRPIDVPAYQAHLLLAKHFARYKKVRISQRDEWIRNVLLASKLYQSQSEETFHKHKTRLNSRVIQRTHPRLH